MTKAERVLAFASIEVGTVESPANSNRTKYGKWFGLDGVPWCGIFVSWVFDKAGANLGNIGFSNGFAGCHTAVAHFKKTKQTTTTPKPGDIVFFDWQWDGRYDHTGIYEGPVSETQFSTFEGNTSIDNNSNGGKVMRRIRTMNRGVLFVHPKVLDR
jgi:hypothetical protein